MFLLVKGDKGDPGYTHRLRKEDANAKKFLSRQFTMSKIVNHCMNCTKKSQKALFCFVILI